MCRAFCDRQGWEVVAIYSDKEMSGKTRRRPGCRAMLEAANARAFDVLVFEAFDRLTRRVSHAITSFDQFLHLRIDMHSVTEGRQDTMSIMLRAWGAQAYADSVADRTRRGLRQRLVKDQRSHSLACGCRKRDAENGLNRAIDAEQAGIVRRIFDETARGLSARAIVRGLTRDGIPPPAGNGASRPCAAT
jgi:site-specific DNA recombinase